MATRSEDIMAAELEKSLSGIVASNALSDQVKGQLDRALSEARETAAAYRPDRDPWIYYIVVGILGLVLLIVVWGAVIQGRELDPAMVALGSAALGALAGLLAPSPRSSSS